MNSKLKKDVQSFLNIYHKFSKIEYDKLNLCIIRGEIDIIDSNSKYWTSYNIAIIINENEYPNTIPVVLEVTDKITRTWDYHISEKGECCLDIPHNLEKLKHRGINLVNFFRNTIYPFFANHQYRLAEGEYANGEYEHFEEGIIQFYREQHNLTNPQKISQYISLALGKTKADRNLVCPICGGRKYKNCCLSIINKLKKYGHERLSKDFDIFCKILK